MSKSTQFAGQQYFRLIRNFKFYRTAIFLKSSKFLGVTCALGYNVKIYGYDKTFPGSTVRPPTPSDVEYHLVVTYRIVKYLSGQHYLRQHLQIILFHATKETFFSGQYGSVEI